MARKANWLLILVALISCPRPLVAADPADPLTSLLQQEDVNFTVPAGLGRTQQNLAALTDGKTTRLLELKLEPGVAIDLTYHVPEVATVRKLLVFADTKQLSKKQVHWKVNLMNC